MRNKLLKVSSLLLLTGFFANAQDNNWRQSYLNENANYYDIVNQQRQETVSLQGTSKQKTKKQIKQFERWADYWKNRIKPDGTFVSSQFNYNEWKKEQLALQAKNSNAATGGPWNFIGPIKPPNSLIPFYPGMGRVNAIAFNPSNTNIIYVGAATGGIWKSTDGGATWAAKGDSLPVLGISDIVIDPTNENIIYIASGDFDGQSSFSAGVLKSTDAGETWNVTGLSPIQSARITISKLLLDPNNTSNILATTKGSIKRSTDGGATWTNVRTGSKFYNDIAYKVGSATIIYATTSDGEFLKSTDNGATWSSLTTLGNTERTDIALTANDTNLILILNSDGKMFKSVNEGATWTNLPDVPNFDAQTDYNQEIAISPIDKNLIIVGGINGHRSKDGGATWERYLDGYWVPGEPYFYVHSDHHELKFLPGTSIVLNGNDGGVFKGDASKDVAWEDLSSGLAITQYYCVAGTPQDPNKLIMGAQDNDIAVYDGTNFTGHNAGSDGVEGLWDYSDSNHAWSCSQSGTLERTDDGFQTTNTITTPSGAPFVWQLEIHPTIPTTIYGGFGDINKSTDRGDTWTALGSGIVNTISSIAIAQSDANTIFVSGENTIKKTTNGGTSWTSLTLPQAGTVKDVAIHPTNPNKIVICYSGYTTGKVYSSANGGTTWTNISGTLPNVPSFKMTYRTGTNEIYLTTDLGVYFKKETDTDWTKLNNGLPNVSVTDLAINYATNRLRVSTHGRGLWEVSLVGANLSTEDSNIESNNVSIYPNPTVNKTINIEFNNLEGTTNVLIYNTIGGVVKHFDTSNLSETLNLSNYPTGLYFVKVSNAGKSITKKVILN